MDTPIVSKSALVRQYQAARRCLDSTAAIEHVAQSNGLAVDQVREIVAGWEEVPVLLQRGADDMALQLDLATRLINRYRDTGRIAFTGPDYQLAKVGVQLMDELARITDPAQSHDAADRARQFAPSHRDRIKAALEQHGPRTAHELEPLTGLTVVQIDRRMHELCKCGEARPLVVNGQEVKRGTPSGGMAQVWEAV